MVAGTTKLRRVECFTRALASNHCTGAHDLQLLWAVSVQVSDTAGVLAVAVAVAGGPYAHAYIVPVGYLFLVHQPKDHKHQETNANFI